jgi:hypothetical protein
MSHDDFESVPGLPGPLPSGERLIWQGVPRWTTLARRAFHVPLVSLYLAGMVALRASVLWSEGQTPSSVAMASLSSALLSVIAIGVLTSLAWLSANATTYTVTSRRIAIRHGISVGLTLNVPFATIDAASLKAYADGSGQISLKLVKGTRIGYLLNWPHVRPGKYTNPEPTLRALADVQAVGRIIATALAESEQPPAAAASTTARPPGISVRLPNSVAA